MVLAARSKCVVRNTYSFFVSRSQYPMRRSRCGHRFLPFERRKRTDDDLPVRSFRTLLTELGRLAVNTMQVAGDGNTLALQTEPTPLQQPCLELLAVTSRA